MSRSRLRKNSSLAEGSRLKAEGVPQCSTTRRRSLEPLAFSLQPTRVFQQPARRRGSLLIVTLWLVAVLSMLSIAISQRMAMELRLTRYQLAHARAQALARGGVRYAMALLAADQSDAASPADWLGEAWAFNPDADRRPSNGAKVDPTVIRLDIPEGDRPATGDEAAASTSTVELRLVDEERKLDINRLTDPVYSELLSRLIGPREAVDRLLDYVDADDQPLPDGLEKQDSPPYVAKNAPIVRLEEVRHIPGLFEASSQGLWARLSQGTSPYLTSTSRVNINTAPREVLEAVFGNPQMAEAVLAFRWDPGDGDPRGGNHFVGLSGDVQIVGTDTGIRDLLSPLMTGPLGNILGVQSQRFVIEAVTRLASPAVEYHLEAVIGRDQQAGGHVILAWQQS